MQRLKTLPRESFIKIFQLLPENEILTKFLTMLLATAPTDNLAGNGLLERRRKDLNGTWRNSVCPLQANCYASLQCSS
ncbi:MAG: hypothetical protein RMX65_034210 [Nostoc sp. DedQUE01]